MITIIVITCIVVAVIAALIPAIRGAPRSSDRLEPIMQQLLDCELERVYLRVRLPYRRTPFAQVEKKYDSEGRAELVLAFPIVSWSGAAHREIEKFAQARNIPYITRPHGNRELRFLFVNFQNNTDIAADCVQFIFKDLFHVDEKQRLRVRLDPLAKVDLNLL